MNEIILHENYAEIVLYNRKNEEVSRTLIDLDDVDRIKNFKWSLNSNNYPVTGHTYLHRFIMDCPKGMTVDHIDHDTLNNRKNNLRICTMQQNSLNKKLRQDNSSGYTGVYWSKLYKKWIVQIVINDRKCNLGSFSNKIDAIEARKQAEEKYYGEYVFRGELKVDNACKDCAHKDTHRCLNCWANSGWELDINV